MPFDLTPETVGTIIGTAFMVIAGGLGLIRRTVKKSNGTPSADSGESGKQDAVLDIVADYRERLEKANRRIAQLDRQGERNEQRHQKEMAALIADYDKRLTDCLKANLPDAPVSAPIPPDDPKLSG